MFTGLVEEVGKVQSIVRGARAELVVTASVVSHGTKLGDSIAVNGVCLTVTKISGQSLSFDAVEETLSRSSLGKLRSSDPVNLERSVSADRLFGGHFVLGHVDGVGTITRLDQTPGETVLVIKAPQDVTRYVVAKGSIAIDGISLTVASCTDEDFRIAVIPHTLDNTNLVSKRPGDIVNLEADIIGKYVEKFVTARAGSKGVSMQMLADAGWLEE